MVDITRETTFIASPMRMLLLGLGGIVMTAGSFAVAWPLFSNVQPGSFHQFVGWFGTVFFAACTVLIFSRAFGKNRPTLMMSPQGFRFNSVSADLVPWRSVTSVSEWSHQRQRMIIVGVTEDVWNSQGITRIASWTRSANRGLGADGLAIPASGMPIKFEELMWTFLAYAEAYSPRRPT